MASGSNQSMTPGEELLMVIVGCSVLMVAARALLSLQGWHWALDWLVAHQVLVGAADGPLVRLPGGQGVGLDAPRAAITAAVAAGLLIVSGISAARRRGQVPQ